MYPKSVFAAVVSLLALGLHPVQAFAQPTISESAYEIMTKMSDYFGNLQKFSTDYDADFEIVTGEGQKLQLGHSGSMAVDRATGAHIVRNGEIANVEFIYDGAKLTLYGVNINSYFQIDSAEGLDKAIDDFRHETGLPAPGADLLATNLFETLTHGVKSGEFYGTTFVDGVLTYHLAFREADVDWQIWVRADDHPVPMKYVITTKWVTGAPQYSIRFRNWNFEPQFAADLFKFEPPADSINLENIQVNEMGELVLEKN